MREKHEKILSVSYYWVTGNNTVAKISLVAGGINNDNQLDIFDYNALIGCFGSKQTTATCTNPHSQATPGADITDDCIVNGADYNLFL